MKNSSKTTDTRHETTPATIVIFGISGDLATRKLLPSLYELEKSGHLDPETRVIGVTRKGVGTEDLFRRVKDFNHERAEYIDANILDKLRLRIEILQMDASMPDDYPKLKNRLDEREKEVGSCMNRLYYLSVPPKVSEGIVACLGVSGLNRGCAVHGTLAHLLLEKPFGFDMKSAKDLIKTRRKFFEEKQIFRIDHYLAKETVQDIITFRFRNPIFGNIWNKDHIESLEVIADERLDIEGRADFYEQVGALRDIIQSHLLHVLSVVMMDRPKDITNSDNIHAMRREVLENIKPVSKHGLKHQAIRGRYRGYREEAENPNSIVETFAVLKLYSKEARWKDVPIYLRTGKALTEKKTCVIVEFKPRVNGHDYTNKLTFHIQPDEGITIELWAKKPGFQDLLQTVPMRFSYRDVFGDNCTHGAYEHVLLSAIRGDNTLFATSEEVMASWKILQGVLDAWKENGGDLVEYEKGSAGPNLDSLID